MTPRQDLTPKQYRQANGAIFPVIVVILGYFVVTLLAAIVFTGGTVKNMGTADYGSLGNYYQYNIVYYEKREEDMRGRFYGKQCCSLCSNLFV